MKEGLVHLYWGKGKGKTTAAVGLAVRALGHGRKVAVVQFLKNGGSGEVGMLRRLGAEVYAGKPEEGFASRMNKEEQQKIRERQNRLLQLAMESECQLLILDEACEACSMDLVDPVLLKAAVLERPAWREIVLTGRKPPDWMREAADYCTCMQCQEHPYEKGIRAREGIEF